MAKSFTYDPKSVIITFGSVAIEGFADDIITVTPNEDFFTKQVGADGEVSRARSANRTHDVVITLKQTSLSNLYLSGILEADGISNAGALPLSITDLGGSTLFFWPEAWIRTPPEVGFGKELKDREWTFDTGQPSSSVIGGANVIGG